MIDAEREVLGSDYQANGYTTLSQAERIGVELGLGAGDRLLDVGSGCGYPGLYLAHRFGSSVTSIDPVVSGATSAAARAERMVSSIAMSPWSGWGSTARSAIAASMRSCTST